MLRSHSHALPGAHAGSIGRQRSRGGGTASAHMRARQRAPPRSVTAAPPPWRPKTGWRGACVEVSGRRGCGRSGSCSWVGVDWQPRFDAASSFRTALPDPCRTAQTALVLALRYIDYILGARVGSPFQPPMQQVMRHMPALFFSSLYTVILHIQKAQRHPLGGCLLYTSPSPRD